MRKMQCLVRYSLPASATVQDFTEKDEAVILILQTQAAVDLANRQWGAECSGPFRIAFAHGQIQHNRQLHIPMVHVPQHGEPMEFSDGRHRCLVMRLLGFQVLPVLTARRYAEQTEHLWGDIAQAHREYDFPDDDVTVIVGR